VQPYFNMSGNIDWSPYDAEAAAFRTRIPSDSVLGFTQGFWGFPENRFFHDRPYLMLPNTGFLQLAERTPTVVVARADIPDPQREAALAAGARILFESGGYSVLTFDDPAAIPPALDPDG
jgi:hypothetical protein